MSDTALTVSRLSKSFGRKTVVDGVSLSVGRGEIVGFLGPNGAGKTTVMNMVMGMIEPDEGEIDLFGIRNGFRRKDVLMRIGFLQEKPRIYPDMSARAYLRFFADLYGLPAPAKRVDAVLERVGLAAAAERRLDTFSRGMQQRACVARVMLHEPDLLILDEPTLGLDPNGIAEMRKIFREMKAHGTTLLFSSHQLAEMERICDSVIFMQEGRVIAAGRQADLVPALASDSSFAVELFEPAAAHIDRIRSLPDVANVRETATNRLDLTLVSSFGGDSHNNRAAIVRGLSGIGLTVLTVGRATPTLEDLFIGLTARTKIAAE